MVAVAAHNGFGVVGDLARGAEVVEVVVVGRDRGCVEVALAGGQEEAVAPDVVAGPRPVGGAEGAVGGVLAGELAEDFAGGVAERPAPRAGGQVVDGDPLVVGGVDVLHVRSGDGRA